MSRPLAVAALAIAALGLVVSTADAGNGWYGKRRVSHQRPNDLFYNYYVGPTPNSAVGQMYVSPQPVPPAMGHTYTTYQPFMPHEYMYGHHRTYYTHNQGAGWTRTKVRYHAHGNVLQALSFGLYDDTYGGWLRRADVLTHHDLLNPLDF